MSPHSIYALVDPDTKEVKYVGRTSKAIAYRFAAHLVSAGRGGDTPLSKWIRQLVSDGKLPEFILVEACEEVAVEQVELKWIQYHNGNLLNVQNNMPAGKHMVSTTRGKSDPLVLLRAPAELMDRFDAVVAAKYTTRSALLRELMAREVEAFFASRPQRG